VAAARKRRAAAAAEPRAALIRFSLFGVLLIGIAIGAAAKHAWITDDAYISFRYARNLVQGLGLVFNAGERVEGYSNFLWTLWCALGMRLGVSPETWTLASGIFCHAGSVLLLLVFTHARSRRVPVLAIPFAAILAALHRDGSVFATSGLETSLFTLLAIVGYLLLALGEPTPRRLAGAGVALALATLTRPDGIVFAAVGGLAALVFSRRRLPAVSAYAIGCLALLLPWALWKLSFYGDLLPNTWYAKSGDRSWYSQGLTYVGLYFARYWMAALALPVALVAAWRRTGAGARSGGDPEWVRAAVVAAGFALAGTWSIAKVGGDFMFARLMIPATPFYLILLELGLERLLPRAAPARVAAAATLAAGIVLTPAPVTGDRWKSGIADEWDYYRHVRNRGAERASGEHLRALFQGLPVRAAFVGTQAMLAYLSEVPVAIEATAGLTDSFTAHQRLEKRGRPGHEKHAPWIYLIDTRRAHLLLTSGGDLPDTLAAYIPVLPVSLDGLVGTVLQWGTPIMEELQRRGARTVDFPATLDEYIRAMPTLPDSAVRADYVRLRRFYFDTARDSAREAPFLARLGRAGTR